MLMLVLMGFSGFFYLLNVQYWIVSNAFGLIVRFVSNESNDFSGPPSFSLIFLGIVLRSSVYTKTHVGVIKRRAQRKALPPCSSKLCHLLWSPSRSLPRKGDQATSRPFCSQRTRSIPLITGLPATSANFWTCFLLHRPTRQPHLSGEPSNKQFSTSWMNQPEQFWSRQ